VGCMMMRQVTSVNWQYIGDALPAFVTIVSMPFCYSVAYGLIAGLFTYVVLNGGIYVTRKVSGLVFGREIEPPDADKGEYWTYKTGGSNPPVSFNSLLLCFHLFQQWRYYLGWKSSWLAY
jgi:AGZA family xanthine/uracil permease-like MFS transporter